MKAIFYKEWIKTRIYLSFAFIMTVGFAGYSMLRMYRVADLKGAQHLWEVMLTRDALFVDAMTYVPLIAGIALALVQYMPEMYHKCLKLTLHLPLPHFSTINGMLLFGTGALCACFAAEYLLMTACMHGLLARELAARVLLTALPWHLAGIAAYLLTAWICIEPTWKRRIANIAVSILLLRLYFLAPAPEAYNGFLPLLTVYTLATASLSWLSAVRFTEGKQD